jgi:hypothetical protein
MRNKEAIESLERRLADLERKGNALVEVINDLRHEDGLPPRGPFGGTGAHSSTSGPSTATLTSIKPDTFYGKKLQTAVREYLELRSRSVGGATNPATPRDIYTAITSGGYEFDTKDETTALISLRQLLRKRTAFFHKLPNGTYGLTTWYPDAKAPKAQDDDDGETETPAGPRLSAAERIRLKHAKAAKLDEQKAEAAAPKKTAAAS